MPLPRAEDLSIDLPSAVKRKCAAADTEWLKSFFPSRLSRSNEGDVGGRPDRAAGKREEGPLIWQKEGKTARPSTSCRNINDAPGIAPVSYSAKGKSPHLFLTGGGRGREERENLAVLSVGAYLWESGAETLQRRKTKPRYLEEKCRPESEPLLPGRRKTIVAGGKGREREVRSAEKKPSPRHSGEEQHRAWSQREERVRQGLRNEALAGRRSRALRGKRILHVGAGGRVYIIDPAEAKKEPPLAARQTRSLSWGENRRPLLRGGSRRIALQAPEKAQKSSIDRPCSAVDRREKGRRPCRRDRE